MSDYPAINRGTQFGQIPARQWQNLFSDLRRVVNLNVGPGLRLEKGLEAFRLFRTPVTPASVISSVALATAQFKLTQSADAFPDHLVCRTWDGTTEGAEDVLIAKPWLLRRTPFEDQIYNDVSYQYDTATRRTARVGPETEGQVIIPPFVVGDIIYAVRDVIGGTSVAVVGEPPAEGEPAPIIPVVWLNENPSRAWTAEEE